MWWGLNGSIGFKKRVYYKVKTVDQMIRGETPSCSVCVSLHFFSSVFFFFFFVFFVFKTSFFSLRGLLGEIELFFINFQNAYPIKGNDLLI